MPLSADERATQASAARRPRLAFWAVLAALSTALSEVLAGADCFPFFHAWGLIVVWPLYGLHVVLLAWLIHRFGRPTFGNLFLAGAVLGLYEAYLTKVLWNPPWGAPFVSVGGVAVVESMVLVLFWHPVMAFIAPLLLAEVLYTDSRTVLRAMPAALQRVFATPRSSRVALLLLCVCFGLYQSTNSPSWQVSLLSAPSAAAVVVGLGLVMSWRGRQARFTLAELLPGRWWVVALSAALAILYLFMGFAVRREALPGLGPQAAVWAAYLVLLGGLWATIRGSRHALVADAPPASASPSPWLLLAYAAVVALSSAVGKLLLAPLRAPILLGGWLLFVLIGTAALAAALREATGRPRPAAPGGSSGRRS